MLCTVKSGSLGIHFRPTLEAIGLSTVVSTEWPLLMAYIGWQLATADPNQVLAVALGNSLLYGSCLLWVSEFSMQLLRSGGIAEAHFGWPSFSTQLLKRELRWLTVLGLPLAIIVYGCDHYRGGEWSDSLGRFAFIGAMLVLANFVHAILNAKENVLREAILSDTQSWFQRVQQSSTCAGRRSTVRVGNFGGCGLLLLRATSGVAMAGHTCNFFDALTCLLRRCTMVRGATSQPCRRTGSRTPTPSSRNCGDIGCSRGLFGFVSASGRRASAGFVGDS